MSSDLATPGTQPASAAEVPTSDPVVSRPKRVGGPSKATIWLGRLAIVVIVLALWQFLPEITSLRNHSPVFDPFFVSSPLRVLDRLGNLLFGADGQATMWSDLWTTMKGTLIGVLIGTSLGAAFGLLLSNNATAQAVLSPFVILLNAVPRIALIPIFVIIAGPTLTASVLTAVVTVFFLVFYNAFAGGLSVPIQTVQNARLLGATSWEIMRHVRLQYVLVWTFASLPNAISFGLVAVVTAEILTGRLGMGRLLFNSISSVDSTLTFTVVVILSVVGVALVTVADLVQKRVLHWWEGSS
jgi:NitT/TauT family transport system permease protein